MSGLEQHERPITDVFPQLDPGRRAELSLAPSLVRDFRRDGFCGPVDVLDVRQLDRVRAAVDGVIDRLEELEPQLYEVEAAHRERPGEVVCHFLGGWRVDEVLHDLIRHPAVTVPLAQLLEVEQLRFWHDQVFHKPPGHPGEVPWHQDYSYWRRTGPPAHITMNIVLDDADVGSGCLHFVPGSQRWPLLPTVPFDAPLESIREHLPEGARLKAVPVPARAGQATIHHSRVLHGSPRNGSERPRRAVVLNYMAPDTRCLDGERPLLRGVPIVPAGARVEGPFFPIVL